MNAFEELCKIASRENWCWKIICTTCGHGYFRFGFLEITKGLMPDENWTERRYDVPMHFNPEQKRALLEVCIKADLHEIRKHCKFPDWLGYLGLVIYHCRPSELFPELSKAWVRQLSEMLSEGSQLKDSLKSGRILTIKNLEYIESELLRTS